MKTSSITIPALAATIGLLMHTSMHGAMHRLSSALDRLSVTLSDEERAHVLGDFNSCADASNTSARDTVWARRAYAPMYIHRPELAAYKAAISKALPEYVAAFDVVFAASDTHVPWHCDYDSLGPFDADFRSIARGDFVTVHVNLQNGQAGGGQLRTLSSLPVAIAHYAANTLTSSFGSIAALTAPFADMLGAKTHSGAVGHGHFFNNMATHSVTAGAGRISYVVRLMRKDVIIRRELLEAASSGTLGTRRLSEFERFLPLMKGATTARAGEFPWEQVVSKGACGGAASH